MARQIRHALLSLLTPSFVLLAGCSSSTQTNESLPDATAPYDADASDVAPVADTGAPSPKEAGPDAAPSDAADDASEGAIALPDASDAMVPEGGFPIDAGPPLVVDAGPADPCFADDFSLGSNLPYDAGAPPVRRWCTIVPFAASPQLVAGGTMTAAGSLAAIGYAGPSETESVGGTVLSGPFALTFGDAGAPSSAQIVGSAIDGQSGAPTTFGGAFVTGGGVAAQANGQSVLWPSSDAGAASFVSLPASQIVLLPFPGGDVVLVGSAASTADFGRGPLGDSGAFAARFDAHGSCKWSTPMGAHPTSTLNATVDADGHVSLATMATDDTDGFTHLALARFDGATGARAWLVNLGSDFSEVGPLLAPEGDDVLVYQSGSGLFHVRGSDGSVNGPPAQALFSTQAVAIASDGAGGAYGLAGAPGTLIELFHQLASGVLWRGFIWLDLNAIASNPIVTPQSMFVRDGTLFLLASATPQPPATGPSYLFASAYVGN